MYAHGSILVFEEPPLPWTKVSWVSPVALQPAPRTPPPPCVQCLPTPSVHQFPNRDPGPPHSSPVDPPSRGGRGLSRAGVGGRVSASTWSRSLRSRSMSARESRSNDQAHRRRPPDGPREADPGCRSKLRMGSRSRGGHVAGRGGGGSESPPRRGRGWGRSYHKDLGAQPPVRASPASARALPSLAHKHRHPLHACWAPGRGQTHTQGTPGWLQALPQSWSPGDSWGCSGTGPALTLSR